MHQCFLNRLFMFYLDLVKLDKAAVVADLGAPDASISIIRCRVVPAKSWSAPVLTPSSGMSRPKVALQFKRD